MTDVTFTQDDLVTCVDQLSRGRHKATGQANARFAYEFVWPYSNGTINRDTLNEILDRLYKHYPSYSSRDKANLFVKNFLEFLEDEKGYDLKKYLKIVKGYKPKKPRALNKFNIDDHDVLNLINHIKENQAHLADSQQAITQALFLAFTGMRQETSDRLRVKDVRTALNLAPYPSLLINSDIDKVDMEHYVPIHPVLVPLLEQIVTGKDDDQLIFESKRLYTFLYNHPLPCVDKQTGNFQPRFLRKYFTQKSDAIHMDRDVSDYIQSHNMSSVLWESYKNYTYEEIYERYASTWCNFPLHLVIPAEFIQSDPTGKPLTQIEILEKEIADKRTEIAEKRKTLELIKATPEEFIQEEQDRIDEWAYEQSIKDDETHSLIYESIKLDREMAELEEEIENAKSEKGIHW